MFNGPSILYDVEALQNLYMKIASDSNDLESILELECNLNCTKCASTSRVSHFHIYLMQA